MASITAEFIASLPLHHTGGEGEADPHANYRVDPCTYLTIDGVTGTGECEYSISSEPKEIPKGFHITQHNKLLLGLRKFKVVKDGADTYDIVYVGTLMVQNGFAYISGQALLLEEAPCYLKRVWFPPFAVSFPLECPAGITRKDFVAQVVEQHRGKLIKSIEASGRNDTTKAGMLDFDMNKKRVLYPPHPTCTTCQAELLLDFEDTRCPVCDDPERGQVDHKTAEEAVKEMKVEIKKMEARYKALKFEIEATKSELEAANKALKFEIEAARAQLREALMKVGCMTEEVEEKSNRKAARLAEQLQAAQADNADPDDDILNKRRRMSASEDADKV